MSSWSSLFIQSDTDASNFGVDDRGNTFLFDFDELGLLPESFASYTGSLTQSFTVEVTK